MQQAGIDDLDKLPDDRRKATQIALLELMFSVACQTVNDATLPTSLLRAVDGRTFLDSELTAVFATLKGFQFSGKP